MAKMGMARSESGWMNETSTPVCVKGKGPSSLRQTQSASCFASGGTAEAGQTMESSSVVRVIEKKLLESAHSGTAASAGRRQTANWPETREYFNEGREAMDAGVVGMGFVQPSTALRNAARASRRVESRIGSG